MRAEIFRAGNKMSIIPRSDSVSRQKAITNLLFIYGILDTWKISWRPRPVLSLQKRMTKSDASRNKKDNCKRSDVMEGRNEFPNYSQERKEVSK